jgi:hypothetical protein
VSEFGAEVGEVCVDMMRLHGVGLESAFMILHPRRKVLQGSRVCRNGIGAFAIVSERFGKINNDGTGH